jgi:hypothetical protein
MSISNISSRDLNQATQDEPCAPYLVVQCENHGHFGEVRVSDHNRLALGCDSIAVAHRARVDVQGTSVLGFGTKHVMTITSMLQCTLRISA